MRMAIGAQGGDVLRLVMRLGFQLTLVACRLDCSRVCCIDSRAAHSGCYSCGVSSRAPRGVD
jgi:hypothetical protein